ncbi:MAG TPA: four helix bundle protein [Pseudoxanthomonas sp.]
MSYQLPKVAQDVRRLRVDIELIARNMPNFHRRNSGEELRRRIRSVQGLVVRAWHGQGHGQIVYWLEKLKHEIDMLKEDMQFAQDVRAFQSFGQFQHLFRQVADIGQQTGGWCKQQKRLRARNAEARKGAPQ